MKFIISIFGAVLVLYTFIHYGLSIKCYECNSFYQHDCADYFDNQTVNTIECNVRLKTNISYCRKIVQETYYEGAYHYRYIRQCAALAPKSLNGRKGSLCYERSGIYHVKVRYCHCNDQEGCNHASSTHISYIALSLSSLSAILYHWLYS